MADIAIFQPRKKKAWDEKWKGILRDGMQRPRPTYQKKQDRSFIEKKFGRLLIHRPPITREVEQGEEVR